MTELTCVMVLEADVLVRQPLAEFLRDCGYRVVEALDPDEAKSLMGNAATKAEIMLARGSAGFSIATWMRENHPGVEIILAGSIEKIVAKAGNVCEDGDAETLPYDHKFLLERIKALLAARK